MGTVGTRDVASRITGAPPSTARARPAGTATGARSAARHEPGPRALLRTVRQAGTVFVAALVLGGGSRAAAQTPAIWGDIQPGPHAIGFRVLQLTDSTRPLEDGRPRPLQVWLWYPASAGQTADLTYGDYIDLAETELGSRIPGRPGGVENLHARIRSTGVPAEDTHFVFDATMLGHSDATPLAGPFPVVLIAQGNGNSPYAQALLCEYLASHGFIVGTTPSQTRIAQPPDGAANVALYSAEEQAGDLKFVRDRIAGWLPSAASGPVSIVGYSFGARSALVYTMRYGDVALLVSFDGGIANEAGKDFLDTAPYFQPDRITTPILHFYQPGDDVVKPDFDLLRRLDRSERTLMLFDGMTHGDFSFAGMLETLGPSYLAAVPTGMRPRTGFEAIADLTRVALITHMLADPLNRAVASESSRRRVASAEVLPAQRSPR